MIREPSSVSRRRMQRQLGRGVLEIVSWAASVFISQAVKIMIIRNRYGTGRPAWLLVVTDWTLHIMQREDKSSLSD
jgi:hypothetical protein